MEHQPNEKARKLAEDALNRLSAELEAGRSDALRNYLATMCRFHRYSWGNVLLINSQRPTATHVAGFHTWHHLGRHVKQGEKGIMIFAPVVVKQEPAQGEEKSKDPFRLAGFRTAYVFDIAQTDGKPLPEFAKTTGDPKDYTEKLKALVSGQGITVEYDPSIAPAQGMSSGGRIRLQPSLSPAEEFSVLAHELAHEMLHHGKDAPRLSKLVRETNTAAADYIALYNGDKKTLAESLAVIQATSAKILDHILPEQQRPLPASQAAAPGSMSPSPKPEQSADLSARAPADPPQPATQARDAATLDR